MARYWQSAYHMAYLGTEPALAIQTWYHWISDVTSL